MLQDVHVGRDINLTVNQAARVAAAVDEKVRFASLLAERTALFAGREAEMDQLSRFADGVGGYLFVSAPSGYGKTALLANWVSQLEAREQPVAYAFINRLAGHASEDGTLRALCQQLAEFHGETTAVPASIGELHARYLELLTTPPVGTSIAVVIDGLDEADGWTATRDLFPPILPEGVAVVLSAREVADRDWIEVVGLKSAKPQRLRLGTLDAAQIGEVVAAAGVPPWAHDQEALKQIHSLSEGDPLYVRYLVDDLTPDEDGQARFASLADLGRQPAGPSGLTGYFDTWWEQLAEAEGESTGLGDAVFDFLCYLLVAKGPLTRDDLSHVSLDDNLDDRTIDKVSAAVRRFIVGDRRVGYSLGHPRFQSYLSEERLTEPTRRPYRDRLIAFCARWDEHGSLYALRHYAEHLAEAEDDGEFFTLVRDEEFAAAQSSYLPSEPRLPAKACELAYATAADKDDAPGMAEFALQKARRLAAARTALSPLAAAREINVETAWALADLHEPQDRDLWYLLVAWELKEAGQPGVAQVTLGRLA